MVFGSMTGEGTIKHLKCQMMPTNLDEDTYVKIYRKQQALFRHGLWKVMNEVSKMKYKINQDNKIKQGY